MKKVMDVTSQMIFDHNSMEFSDVSSWSTLASIGVSIAVFIAVLSGGYCFLIDDKLQELSAQRDFQSKQIDEFGQKYALVSNKNIYVEQMVVLDLMFNSFREKMPVDAQVPETIEDITHIASQSGLITSVISLESLVDLGLYSELPIAIDVEGSYHDLGKFVAGLTQLRRLVSLHDFSLKALENGDLALDLKAKIYQFNTEENSL
jgi:type IV pilus assembly protein PilO